MLYDPKWEKKIETKPTIPEFIAWLETKDPTEEYDYASATDCAYVQFLKARGAPAGTHLGPLGIPHAFSSLVHPFWGAGTFRSMWRGFCGQSYCRRRGWTFGDLLRRARAV